MYKCTTLGYVLPWGLATTDYSKGETEVGNIDGRGKQTSVGGGEAGASRGWIADQLPKLFFFFSPAAAAAVAAFAAAFALNVGN